MSNINFNHIEKCNRILKRIDKNVEEFNIEFEQYEVRRKRREEREEKQKLMEKNKKNKTNTPKMYMYLHLI